MREFMSAAQHRLSSVTVAGEAASPQSRSAELKQVRMYIKAGQQLCLPAYETPSRPSNSNKMLVIQH